MKIPKRRFEASVPSMAMGDIAFLLLIFFVILAKAQDDSHLRWEPAADEQLEQAKNYKASVVIDVNGLGYQVHVPLSTFDRLPRVGAEIALRTHMIMREDDVLAVIE